MAETLIGAECIVPGDLTTIAPGHVLVRDGVIAAVGEGPPRAGRTCGWTPGFSSRASSIFR